MKNNKEYFYMLAKYQSEIKWIPAEVGELFFWQDDLKHKKYITNQTQIICEHLQAE